MRTSLFGGSALFFTAGAALFVACSGSNGNGAGPGRADAGPSDDAGAGPDAYPTPAAWNAPVSRPSDTAAAASRSACTFARGDMPAKTLGSSTPVDVDIPIENIVVVMMENRSFDSMFGHLNEYGMRTDVSEPPAGASNPTNALDGGSSPGDAGADDGGDDAGTHPWMHAPQECFADTDHSWKGQHWAWDNGNNDGFYAENNGTTDPGDVIPDSGSLLDGERAMWWYDQTDIPFDYKLANTFAVADNYFCSLLGPTGPNRFFLVAGTSLGYTYNTPPTISSTSLTDNLVVPDELAQRGISWGLYSDGTPSLIDFLAVNYVGRYPTANRFAFQDFLTAAQKGTLPQVAWVDPAVGIADGTPTNNDDHPPADIQIGSQFLSQVYQAVTTSPQWSKTALFITWDENGGEYDHVPPPQACAPDSIAPILTGGDVGVPGDFTRYGFRVPLIVVSPFAKKGYVSHGVYDHTSIARFIETKFRIPALTARDANADPLMDLFDFSTAAFASPPSIPAPTVDDAGLATCIQEFPLPN
jgi:phospholipase C